METALGILVLVLVVILIAYMIKKDNSPTGTDENSGQAGTGLKQDDSQNQMK